MQKDVRKLRGRAPWGVTERSHCLSPGWLSNCLTLGYNVKHSTTGRINVAGSLDDVVEGLDDVVEGLDDVVEGLLNSIFNCCSIYFPPLSG